MDKLQLYGPDQRMAICKTRMQLGNPAAVL